MAVDGKDTSDHIKQRIVYETPCADGWIRADEAGHLRTLLEQMLQKNPAERIDVSRSHFQVHLDIGAD